MKSSLEIIHPKPADQKVPHLLLMKREEPSLLADAVKKYFWL